MLAEIATVNAAYVTQLKVKYRELLGDLVERWFRELTDERHL